MGKGLCGSAVSDVLKLAVTVTQPEDHNCFPLKGQEKRKASMRSPGWHCCGAAEHL